MNSKLAKDSALSAIYFSVAVFVVIYLAGLIFEFLLGTTEEVDISVVLLIVLFLTLILFFVAVTNLVLGEHASTATVFDRVLAVSIFLLLSTLILGILGFVFYVPV